MDKCRDAKDGKKRPTHLLEAGVGLMPIQLLLGHRHLQTTMLYLHLQSKDITNVRSPIDIFYDLKKN